MTTDAQDLSTTTSYTAAATVISTSTAQGAGQNYDTRNLTTQTTQHGDATTVAAYDSKNDLVWQKTTYSDNPGSDYISYNASGATLGQARVSAG